MYQTYHTPQEKKDPNIWVMRYGWMQREISRMFFMNEITLDQYDKYLDLLTEARRNKFGK